MTLDPFSFMACMSLLLMLLGVLAPPRLGFTGRYVVLFVGAACLLFTLALHGCARAGFLW